MPHPVEKVRRHRAIRELVERDKISSQEALGHALQHLGHSVTQSTLSRDLRELGISRVSTGGGYRYVPARGDVPGRPASTARIAEVCSVESNESAVVVRTLPGRAQGVAVELDALELEHALGTVAGDDTILVIPRSTKKTKPLRRVLADLFGFD